MTGRSLLISTVASLFIALPLFAQDEVAQPEVQNSKNTFVGVIKANAVNVRSGPGESNYPTLKLDKGDTVTVVGIKNSWLKIVPPAGSFCYIPKVFVDKRGDGSVGRANKPELRVYAGSALSQMKGVVVTRLPLGTDVTILGEQDEYYKIKPPEGAFYYIHEDFVDPLRNANQPAVVGTATTNTQGPSVTTTPTTRPAVAETPSTQPGEADVEAEKFDKAEAQLTAVSSKPLEEQPIPELLASFEQLANSDKLPESMRRMAEHRVKVLKIRNAKRTELLALRKMEEERKRKALALKAEQQELQERLDNLQVYSAVGTMQTSSLQQGAQTLYRLTDPASGRTLIYVRSNDPKCNTLINQLVGIRGEITVDPQLSLKVITPSSLQAVDPAKGGISAQIMPPSMLTATPKAPATRPAE